MLKTKTKQQGKQRILFKFPKVLSSVLVCYLYSEQGNKNQNIFKVLLILFCTGKKKENGPGVRKEANYRTRNC